MNDYIWPSCRNEKTALTGSVVISVFLHAVLVAVLASTSIFHPKAGESELLDVLWFYHSEPSEWRTFPSAMSSSSRTSGSTAGAMKKRIKDVSQPKIVRMRGSAPAKETKNFPGSKVEAIPLSPYPGKKMFDSNGIESPLEENQSKKSSELPAPAAIEVLPEMKDGIKERLPARVSAGIAVNANQSQREGSEVTIDAGRGGLSPMTGKTNDLEISDEPVTALETARSLSGKSETEFSTVRMDSANFPAASLSHPLKPEGETKPLVPEGKGIFLPPARGDLKLEIVMAGPLLDDFRMIVLYRHFPCARRNRPLSKVEYKHFRTLTPRQAKTGESSIECVVALAEEGAYDFRVESGPEQQLEASFTLKLYENGARARSVPIGKKRVNIGESVVKVLMPEGILWDDDLAFSGSMEDSESITKFNADTGLVWKEYK